MIKVIRKAFYFFAGSTFLYLIGTDTVWATQTAEEQFLSRVSLNFVYLYNKLPSVDEVNYMYDIGSRFCECRFTYGDSCIPRFTDSLISALLSLG